MVDIEKAKEVAIKEVNSRVVSLEDAKDSFKKWIKRAGFAGGFKGEVFEFWQEVINQVDLVTESSKKN